jgi:hypothetical protein
MSGLGVGLGGMAAEGALAGGISATDPLHPSLWDTGTGAVGGAALGWGAGKLGKLADTVIGGGAIGGVPISKMVGRSSVDPDAAVAVTGKAKTAAYDALTKVPG